MSITIAPERPDTPDARALIAELEDILNPLYPPESRHGYSIEKLLREQVTFFLARVDGRAAGCGGVQVFGTEYGEVKRMYVRPGFRGLGLARRLLEQIEAHTIFCGAPLLRLETGIYQPEAIALYERMGFTRIPPFGPYRPDPLSICYEKKLDRDR